MTISNTGRIFVNGDSYTTVDEKTRLANTDRETLVEGLEAIQRCIDQMNKILNPPPKKKRGRKPKNGK